MNKNTFSPHSHLPQFRTATVADVDLLSQLEQICFSSDQISRRQWRYLLTQANADVIIGEYSDKLVCYVLVLYNKATVIARIYSIVVMSDVRRMGLGKQLVQNAERSALIRNCKRVRLEIRIDNVASINLFESLNYQRFGMYEKYYENAVDAFRYEKILQ